MINFPITPQDGYACVIEKELKIIRELFWDIEDIYFFEVNTKYISSSELKTSKFSRVRSTSENLDVFKSRDEIFGIYR